MRFSVAWAAPAAILLIRVAWIAAGHCAVRKAARRRIAAGRFYREREVRRSVFPGMHGSTFGGGPLACAAALEFLTTSKKKICLRTFASAARNCAPA